MPLVTGTTRIIVMIGHPITQVRSPVVTNALFAERGLDRVVVPFDVRPGGGESFFAALRDWQNCDGCLITVPYKQAALAAADHPTKRARLIGACNVLRREADGSLSGDMFDGLGYIAALANKQVSVKGMNTTLVGAGGVGGAIAHALAENGARRIAVLDPNVDRQRHLLQTLRDNYDGLDVSDEPGARDALDLVANASPVGMGADDPYPFTLDGLATDAVITDVVTKPPVTPWLEAAKARGHLIQLGHEMADEQQKLFLDYFDQPATT